jgi:hypothetical protein
MPSDAKKPIVFAMAIIIALAAITLVAQSANLFGVAAEATSKTVGEPIDIQAQPDAVAAVNRAQLDRHVVRALDALGDRFEAPAKGRSILTGRLTRYAGGQQTSSQITIVRELPDKIRVEEVSAGGQRTLGYDGSRSWRLGQSASTEELALIEALARDSIEHFIAGQALDAATLHLGDMFRVDDGSTPDYAGPFYDILRVDDSFTDQDQIRRRSTLYYFNSRTGLPEKIVYDRPDPVGRIEVEFSDWITVAGQKIPSRTTWKESGNLTRQIVISQAQFAPITDDGTFNAPVTR